MTPARCLSGLASSPSRRLQPHRRFLAALPFLPACPGTAARGRRVQLGPWVPGAGPGSAPAAPCPGQGEFPWDLRLLLERQLGGWQRWVSHGWLLPFPALTRDRPLEGQQTLRPGEGCPSACPSVCPQPSPDSANSSDSAPSPERGLRSGNYPSIWGSLSAVPREVPPAPGAASSESWVRVPSTPAPGAGANPPGCECRRVPGTQRAPDLSPKSVRVASCTAGHG